MFVDGRETVSAQCLRIFRERRRDVRRPCLDERPVFIEAHTIHGHSEENNHAEAE